MNTQNPGRGRAFYFHCDRRRSGCGNRVHGPSLDEWAVTAAVAFLNYEKPLERASEAFDAAAMRTIEAEIQGVRSLVASGDMRASDAVPILRGLNERLDAEKAAEVAHGEAEAQVARWHDTRLDEVLEGPGVRRILDNVVVLPGRAGFRWEARNGLTLETPMVEGRTVQFPPLRSALPGL